MKKIDCFGDFCPIPLMKARKTIDEITQGETFLLVTDHSCVVESISDYFALTRCTITIDEVINGVWEIEITKH